MTTTPHPAAATEVSTAAPAMTPLIRAGCCHVSFAYDVGRAIDLDRAEQLITAQKQRDQIKHRRRAPASFQYEPAPLRITHTVEPMQIGEFRAGPTADAVVYDFGAVSITYSIPLAGRFDALLPLGLALYENAALLADSRLRVSHLLETIRPAVDRPEFAATVEDYAIYEIAEMEPPVTPAEFVSAHGATIARLLRSETAPLSKQEVADALACRMSFGVADVTVIDWNAALLLDSAAEDARMVLEFGNVELLEMRHLDRQLDAALDESYRALSRRRLRPGLFRGSYAGDLQRVSRLQVDGAVLFEAVNNALKLLGDQYLARVYRLVSQRFHLAEWDAAILRKLHTLESIYTQLVDRQTTVRMEVLEWIIIILITVSILLPFVPGMPGH